MRSLFKILLNNKLGIFIRNLINYKPVHMSLDGIDCVSVSDAFAWRTDNNFETKFKYSDILDIFYKIKNSWIELHFFTKNGEPIKIKHIDNFETSNEILITKEFLNNIEDYGTFYIYHFTKEHIDKNNIISNRCYLGYSQNKNLFSMVHGNTLAKFKKISNKFINKPDIVKTSFFANHIYQIQKFFLEFDKNELFFANPTSNLVRFTVDNEKHILKAGCSKLINISGRQKVSIKSNCLFLRPTIFSYKDQYLDVHHG